MADATWVGMLVGTEAGQPVGFELALERTLYCRQVPLRAYYATLFTVSAQYRRRGIGRWLLEGINQLVFEAQQAALIFSTFHHGHAGSPTVQSTFERILDWGVQRFYTTPIWSRRLDREPLPALPEPLSVTRVVWPEDHAEWIAQADSASSVNRTLPTLEAFTHTIRRQYAVAFGIDAGFVRRISCRTRQMPGRSGMTWGRGLLLCQFLYHPTGRQRPTFTAGGSDLQPVHWKMYAPPAFPPGRSEALEIPEALP
jgi:GNAT superfamily N-acetyltransferase